MQETTEGAGDINPVTEINKEIPIESEPVDAGNKREGANARKKRLRREAALRGETQEPSKPDNSDVPNIPDVKHAAKAEEKPKRKRKAKTKRERIDSAKANEKLIRAGIEYYARVRGIPKGTNFVIPSDGRVTNSIVDVIGEVPYTIDTNGEVITGPLSEAIAFHGEVIGGEGLAGIEAFMERHPLLVSTVSLGLCGAYLEFNIGNTVKVLQDIQAKQDAAAKGAETPSTSEPTDGVSQ